MVQHSMQCLRCKKRIGILRPFRGSQFCSEDCRRKARTTSARALRDEPDLAEDFEERWLDYSQSAQQHTVKTAGSLGSTMTVLGASVLALLALSYMEQSAPRQVATSGQGDAPGFSETLGRLLAQIPTPTASLHMNEDFQYGIGKWKDAAGDTHWGSPDWSWVSGAIQPGRLRIWSDTAKLRDYRLEFEGRIERGSMAWAFRAADGGNYYASKLALGGTGRNGKAEIIRFAVVGGKESRRLSLPVPVALEKDVFYHVSVKVKGDHFVTLLDGQVIDTWQDSRLRAGGVGFFGERGELASIRSVSLTDPDRFLEKLQSYLQFGFILPYGL